MAKVSKNLFLDAVAVERGERYSAQHGTTLSRLVSDFLARLPEDTAAPDLSPTVRRLLGIAAGEGGPDARDDYRNALWAKYGSGRQPDAE